MRITNLIVVLISVLIFSSAQAGEYKLLKTIGGLSAAAIGAPILYTASRDHYCRAHANGGGSESSDVLGTSGATKAPVYNCDGWQETKVVYDYNLIERGLLLKSTEKLRKSMAANGEPKAKGCDAHHIVPEKQEDESGKNIKSREILEKCGIDIDSHKNGIYLPSRSEPECEGTNHKGLHKQGYFDAVFRKLSEADKSSCDDVENALKELKDDLRSMDLGKDGYGI